MLVHDSTMRPPGRTTPDPDLGIVLQEVEQTLAHVRDFLEALGAAQDCPSLPDDQALAALLSRRERQVLRLVATGATNRQVGAALAIEEGTVKRHMSTILGKLGARDRAEAAGIARAQRLI